jgi:hypothetical protein
MVLIKIMAFMQGDRQFGTDKTLAEHAIRTAYVHNDTRIREALDASLLQSERSGAGPRRAQWYLLETKYEFSPAFNEQPLSPPRSLPSPR